MSEADPIPAVQSVPFTPEQDNPLTPETAAKLLRNAAHWGRRHDRLVEFSPSTLDALARLYERQGG